MLHIIVPALAAFTIATSQITHPCHRRGLLSPARRISMQAVDDSARPPPAMPAIAIEWGCDQATWDAVKNKRGLIKICTSGDEDHFKKRLVALRQAIANPQPAATKKPPPAAASKKKRNKGKDTTLPRKDGPYERYGGLPDTLDEEAISVKVNERSEAKVAKDYAKADGIREELAEMGIRIRDDMRTWSYKKANRGMTIPDAAE
jgi:hypothetical protein